MDFSASERRQARAKWGPRTVTPNVAHILPPDLTPDVLHTFLLRFQLEEVEHRLASACDVRSRDALVRERQQVLASISRVLPTFQARSGATPALLQLELPSSDAVRTIVGRRGAGLRQLEREHGVSVSFRSSGPVWEPDGPPVMVVLGPSDSAVAAAARRVRSLLGLPCPDAADAPPWAEPTPPEDVDAAVRELMLELHEPERSTVTEDPLLKRFDVDLSIKDISSVLLEPAPPGIDDIC